MQCCISLDVHTTSKVASTTSGRLQPAFCHTVRVILRPMACHVLSQAHKAIEQAGDEPGALHALEPARAAVRAQHHKAASFSAHQRAAAKQAPFLLRFSASWIHTAMLTTEVSLLEKKKQYLPAVELLQLLLGACLRQVHLVAVLLAGRFCSCVCHGHLTHRPTQELLTCSLRVQECHTTHVVALAQEATCALEGAGSGGAACAWTWSTWAVQSRPWRCAGAAAGCNGHLSHAQP